MNETQLEKRLQFFDALKDVPLCCLPRYIGIARDKSGSVDYSLVCFCDASAKAYATAVYVLASVMFRFRSDLIFAKLGWLQRIIMIIPRLKLMGVLNGVRALKLNTSEFCLQLKNTIVFTDSMCVLHWLQSRKPLSVFLTYRLKEIKSLEGATFRASRRHVC